MRFPEFLAALSSLVLTGCQSSPQRDMSHFRVMTYNIQWFSEKASPDRIANIKEILADIKPDIIGVQEIESREALEQIFDPAEFEFALIKTHGEQQNLGIVVRKPLHIVQSKLIFTDPELNDSFPGGRDGLKAVIHFPTGQEISAYSFHQKSRAGDGRKATDHQRISAAVLIETELKKSPREMTVIMGDFNDSPDDVSSNIIESGQFDAPGGTFAAASPLMINLTEPLYRQDYVSIDLYRKYLGEALSPIVPDACRENEKFRGIEYRFPDEVKVTQALFDQIMISPTLKPWFTGKINIYSTKAALRGSLGRTEKRSESAEYTEKGTLASDHLPVYADFEIKN